MRKVVLAGLFTMLSFSMTFAQFNFEDILKGSVSDANKLVEGYMTPAMNAIGMGLNQGWYNTAKPHKTLGVDLTVTTSLMYFPTSDQTYFVDNTKLESVKLVSYDGKAIDPLTGAGNVPTVFGADMEPKYRVQDKTTGEFGPEFSGPPGLDLKNTIKVANALPVPMYVLGIGLPKKIDLRVRFSPTLTVGDSKFSLLGLGLMHDVGQYIPGVKALPIDISLFAGYTKIKADMAFDRPDQKGLLEFSSTTVQALISKKVSVLTVYGGVGYNMASSKLNVNGNYDLDDNGTFETKDPVALNFATSGVRATGGVRLKLAVFTLHGDYTLAKYNSLTVGFGINVR
jgi:hypothetical protein